MRGRPGLLAAGLAELFGAETPDAEAALFMIADVLIGLRANLYKR